MPRFPNELRQRSVVQKLRFGFDPEGFFASARRRHGDVFTVDVLDDPWTVLGDAGAVKEVFSHGPDELDSGVANLALRPLIGTHSVSMADGPEHLRRRKAHAAGPDPGKPPRVLLVQNVRQSTARWRRGNRLATVSRAKTPIGTTFTFSLSDQAAVTFSFTRRVSGRTVTAGRLTFTATMAPTR